MRVYLKHKVTGEIKDVEADGEEFRELVKQVTTLGLPAWEQTSWAHVDALKERAKYGELHEEDLGTDAQDQLRFEALKLAAEGVTPEANPHLMLSPGEVEAGLTPEQKQKDLQAQYDGSLFERRATIMDEQADVMADERAERETQPTGQTYARAGGSDVRENVPMPVHPDTSSSETTKSSSDSKKGASETTKAASETTKGGTAS